MQGSPDRDLSAIVLAGGGSTRMGVDKASLVVDGMTMLDRVVRAVERAGATRRVIVGPGHASDAVPDADPVAERSERSDRGQVVRLGPLAGIVGGWQALRRSPDEPAGGVIPAGDGGGTTAAPDHRILVAACDLPAMRASVLVDLVDGSWDHVHGAVAHDGERPQPLLAAFSPLAMRELAAAFQRGERSVRACWNEWDLGHVHFERDRVADADTPRDLEAFTVDWPD